MLCILLLVLPAAKQLPTYNLHQLKKPPLQPPPQQQFHLQQQQQYAQQQYMEHEQHAAGEDLGLGLTHMWHESWLCVRGSSAVQTAHTALHPVMSPRCLCVRGSAQSVQMYFVHMQFASGAWWTAGAAPADHLDPGGDNTTCCQVAAPRLDKLLLHTTISAALHGSVSYGLLQTCCRLPLCWHAAARRRRSGELQQGYAADDYEWEFAGTGKKRKRRSTGVSGPVDRGV